MVLNLEKIVPSPYFRSYWVQQNITDLKQYSAAISDLTFSGKEYREERILLRKTPAPAEATAEGGPQLAFRKLSGWSRRKLDFMKPRRIPPRTSALRFWKQRSWRRIWARPRRKSLLLRCKLATARPDRARIWKRASINHPRRTQLQLTMLLP